MVLVPAAGHRSAMTTETLTARDSATRGFFFALSAYLLWGFLPFYMKAVGHIRRPKWWLTGSSGRCRLPERY
jgi:chloramphenicol-sensitive protein RarD